MYCRTDRECICPECAAEDHSEHDTVTIEDEWMETKVEKGRQSEAVECRAKQVKVELAPPSAGSRQPIRRQCSLHRRETTPQDIEDIL